MIYIVETWLCDDILNSEIALPGYRNRHGGGVLIYVKGHFVCILHQLIIWKSLLFQFVMVLAKLLYHFSTDPLNLLHRFLMIYFCIYNHSMLVVFVTIFC